MQTITINIDEDKKIKLQKKADEYGINVEDFIKITIDDLLSNNENDLNSMIDYIFKKNDELYKRLAK